MSGTRGCFEKIEGSSLLGSGYGLVAFRSFDAYKGTKTFRKAPRFRVLKLETCPFA